MRPESFGWNHEVDLLAAIAERVDFANRLFVMAHSKKGRARLWKPLRIKRPWGKRREKAQRATPARLRERYGSDVIRYVPEE